jgi:hypothetical protein
MGGGFTFTTCHWEYDGNIMGISTEMHSYMYIYIIYAVYIYVVIRMNIDSIPKCIPIWVYLQFLDSRIYIMIRVMGRVMGQYTRI